MNQLKWIIIILSFLGCAGVTQTAFADVAVPGYIEKDLFQSHTTPLNRAQKAFDSNHVNYLTPPPNASEEQLLIHAANILFNRVWFLGPMEKDVSPAREWFAKIQKTTPDQIQAEINIQKQTRIPGAVADYNKLVAMIVERRKHQALHTEAEEVSDAKTGSCSPGGSTQNAAPSNIAKLVNSVSQIGDTVVTNEAISANEELIRKAKADPSNISPEASLCSSDDEACIEALPAGSPVAAGRITSPFGWRIDPRDTKHKKLEDHAGVDIANVTGTPIYATTDGVVSILSKNEGYGNAVKIDNGYGVETLYGHAKKLLVKKGQFVHRGDEIALMGSTGESTGPHVHYEIEYNGDPVDPAPYMNSGGIMLLAQDSTD